VIAGRGALCGALAAGWLAACGPRVGPNGVTSDDAIVIIHSNVRDAQLYLDGRFIASLDALGGGVAIAPGNHRLELRHEDYFSRYLELAVARAERKQLALDLAAILP
jgi:hypothetical protein